MSRCHQPLGFGVGGGLLAAAGCETGFAAGVAVGLGLVCGGLAVLEVGGFALVAVSDDLSGTGISSSGGGVVK